jgi:hypothetical protein
MQLAVAVEVVPAVEPVLATKFTDEPVETFAMETSC